MWWVNLRRCCRTCHHKTTLVSSVPVAVSGHSPAPVTGLLRSGRKRKALPALWREPRPQTRVNSHRRTIRAAASPLFEFQSQPSTPTVCSSQVRGEWRTDSTTESSDRVGETRGGVERGEREIWGSSSVHVPKTNSWSDVVTLTVGCSLALLSRH